MQHSLFMNNNLVMNDEMTKFPHLGMVSLGKFIVVWQ